jgi:hypothetical protein
MRGVMEIIECPDLLCPDLLVPRSFAGKNCGCPLTFASARVGEEIVGVPVFSPVFVSSVVRAGAAGQLLTKLMGNIAKTVLSNTVLGRMVTTVY